MLTALSLTMNTFFALQTNQTNPWTIGLLLAVILPIYFSLVWYGACTLLCWLSGWRQLARHYRTLQVPPGKTIASIWTRVGIVSYRNTLTFQPAPEGLYLKTWFFLRIAHPPLLIPWHAVKVADSGGKGRFSTARLTLGDPVITTLRVPKAWIEEGMLNGYRGG
jgi:hypothetical protein